MKRPPEPSPAPTESADPLLLPFLRERDESEARRLLGELLTERAEPLVKAIVRRRLRSSADGDDVRGQAVLRLLMRLEQLRAQEDAPPILDFAGYVATVTVNACDDSLRLKYPQRWRLRNRLRYLLTHDPAFTFKPCAQGQWLCGLNGRSVGGSDTASPARAVAPWSSDPRACLRSLLLAAGEPLELEELVARVGGVAGITDRPAESALPDTVTASGLGVVEALDQRLFVERLWREVCDLPVRQRVALLLNLRDPTTPDVIRVFPLIGVASLREIAQALEMRVEELAALWDALPLDDRVIAARLGLERQQVINLRKAARARLGRRLAGFGRPLR